MFARLPLIWIVKEFLKRLIFDEVMNVSNLRAYLFMDHPVYPNMLSTAQSNNN